MRKTIDERADADLADWARGMRDRLARDARSLNTRMAGLAAFMGLAAAFAAVTPSPALAVVALCAAAFATLRLHGLVRNARSVGLMRGNVDRSLAAMR